MATQTAQVGLKEIQPRLNGAVIALAVAIATTAVAAALITLPERHAEQPVVDVYTLNHVLEAETLGGAVSSSADATAPDVSGPTRERKDYSLLKVEQVKGDPRPFINKDSSLHNLVE